MWARGIFAILSVCPFLSKPSKYYTVYRKNKMKTNKQKKPTWTQHISNEISNSSRVSETLTLVTLLWRSVLGIRRVLKDFVLLKAAACCGCKQKNTFVVHNTETMRWKFRKKKKKKKSASLRNKQRWWVLCSIPYVQKLWATVVLGDKDKQNSYKKQKNIGMK